MVHWNDSVKDDIVEINSNGRVKRDDKWKRFGEHIAGEYLRRLRLRVDLGNELRLPNNQLRICISRPKHLAQSKHAVEITVSVSAKMFLL